MKINKEVRISCQLWREEMKRTEEYELNVLKLDRLSERNKMQGTRFKRLNGDNMWLLIG